MNISAIYNTKSDWGAQYRAPTTLQNFNGMNGNNPNGLSKKQEMMVRSAIKYWVERHKHVVRLVNRKVLEVCKMLTQIIFKARCGHRRNLRLGSSASHVDIDNHANFAGLPGNADCWRQRFRLQRSRLSGLRFGSSLFVLYFWQSLD